MTIVVEDGTGLADANSYASEDEYDTYLDDRGYTTPDGDSEEALIRATQILDATYGGRFSGTRTHGRDQALEWPRTGATDRGGLAIDDDEIPIEIINATIEMAFREATTPGSLMPDLERGGAITSVRAGSVGVTYASNAPNSTVFQLIQGILAPLIGAIPMFVGTSTRG